MLPSNVVIVTVDCLRAEDWENISSPSPEGTDSIKMISPGGATRYSMPAILTGSHVSEMGGYPSIEGVPTLANILNNAGYDTHFLHGNPWLNSEYGFGPFRDIYAPTVDGSDIHASSNNGDESENLTSLLDDYLPDSISSIAYPLKYRLLDAPKVGAENLVDEAISRLSSDENTAVWLHLMDLHRPYSVVPRNPLSLDYYRLLRFTRPEFFDLPADARPLIQETYKKNLQLVSRELGRLVDEAVDNDTLWILTSDHGEEFGNEGNWFHRNDRLNNELLNVPFEIRSPSDVIDVEGPVSGLDIAPTIARVLGDSLENTRGVPLQNGGSKFPTAEVHTQDRHHLFVTNGDENIVRTKPPESPENKLEAKALDVFESATQNEQTTIDEAAQKRLQRLGYVDL
mgnify:CR=1 FL=1